MLEIVVSHYNNKQFEKILDLFSDSKITIYDKSQAYKNAKWANIIKSKNIGREAETYLNHIILNYDNLSEYTLFMQDDTNNHIPSNSDFIENIHKVMNEKQQFHLFKSTYREGGEVYIRTINDGYFDMNISHAYDIINSLSSPDAIIKVCEKFNINLPKTYTTETCAFFILHRDMILKRSKEFYINLRLWSIENEKNYWVLEYIWKLMFV
jgi:hypothetical protein